MPEDQQAPAPSDRREQRAGGLNTKVDGLTVKSWIAIAATIAVVVLGFGAWWTYGPDRGI